MAVNSYSLDLERDSTQFAYCTDTAPLSITGNLTIEAWIKPESVPGGTSTTYSIAGKYDNATPGRSYHFGYQTDGGGVLSFQFAVSNDGTNVEYLRKAYTLTAGTWYHVAVVFTAATSTAEFFVGGSSVGTATGTYTAIHNNASLFMIGGLQNGATTATETFDGLIDEVKVWNTIRTGAQILADSTSDSVADTSLVGYWKLNNDYADATTNAATLTASGSPVFSSTVQFSTYATDNTGFLAFFT